MILPPDIDWLRNKWNLPENAFGIVENLIQAERNGSTALEIPDAGINWGDAVGQSKASEESTPLVLIQHRQKRYLQSRRLYCAERVIASRLLKLAEETVSVGDFDLTELFPGAAEDDRQILAARCAMSRKLTIITGGPGTGKTYVLARILALLLRSAEQGDSGINTIRLAAPTGKASDRMKKAVTDSLLGLPMEFQQSRESLIRVAESSSTLHSLLGYNPDSGCCRFNADRPLPVKVLIVDECSMVDVLLWKALIEALPQDARLILLGDPHQLESVGQGNVFAEITRVATEGNSIIGSAHVHLKNARRFKDRPDILRLARALENADGDAAVELLKTTEGVAPEKGLAWIKTSGGTLPCSEFPKVILDALGAVARSETPQAAIESLGRICILTAQREYFVGSKAMSEEINHHFMRQSGVRNQPIIINRNDSETGLRNGAVGVIHTLADGNRRAFFPAGDGSLREIAVAKLPEFGPAWAITIHRSQGSEYEEVLVILPRQESPMNTRELIYTAITRAKKTVYIAGNLASVQRAAGNPSTRVTVLGAHLSHGPQFPPI